MSTDDNNGESLLIVTSMGPEVAERCFAPFIIASAAQMMDVKVEIFMMMDAVILAMKGAAKHVKAPGFPPLPDLIQSFFDEGGKIWVCSNSQHFRRISPKSLVEGTEIAGVAKMVELMMDFDKTLSI
ncbi:MAG: DsrE family protein [Candidatus Heimdallarchaeota archaeon]|nr:DsrE family protein [Candidatus Heimdallarchaeota archaeon]MCK5049372.1 DsrE family protein [Candidatus Heimdallarchaeota archaeon]